MKPLSLVMPIAFAAGLAFSASSFAQQAPAGSTGVCKDGTYTSTETKRGACRGHGGVKDWYGTSGKSEKSSTSGKSEKSSTSARSEKGATAATTAGTAGAATTNMPAERAQKTASAKTPKGMRAEAAPGGGPGKVWLNTSSNVYHCSGDEWYGKTKAGEYLSESEAKAKGAHAARGKACT
jgi:uncharacterized protein DUF3761